MKQVASILMAMVAVAIPGVDQFQSLSHDALTAIHLVLEIVQAGLAVYIAPAAVRNVRAWVSRS